MKLHFTYNFSDLARALKVAEQTAEFADIIGVGSLLLLKEGVRAVQNFKAAFPNKEIFAEARITEKADESVTMLAQAGASYISVLAGTFHSSIKKAVDCANRFDVKIALDLLDSSSFGQSAMDAQNLGVHILILNRTPGPENNGELEREWESVRENTKLPIFVTGKIDEVNFAEIAACKIQGIMIGSAITKADNPAKMAHLFRLLL